MSIVLTPGLKEKLRRSGVETFINIGTEVYPDETRLEPPCSTKWMSIQHSLELGSFSYAVSGYYFATRIGRYVSIGEGVQIGRGDHPTTWLSTSPAFYLSEKLFDVGGEFPCAAEYHTFKPELDGFSPLPTVKPVFIGNDVWIGHEAMIRPGVTIGDGAIIASRSVVTRDVEPYAVVAGVPASVKKYRFDDRIIQRLLKCKWWQLAPWQLRGIDVSRPEVSIGQIEERVAGTPAFVPGFIEVGKL